MIDIKEPELKLIRTQQQLLDKVGNGELFPEQLAWFVGLTELERNHVCRTDVKNMKSNFSVWQSITLGTFADHRKMFEILACLNINLDKTTTQLLKNTKLLSKVLDLELCLVSSADLVNRELTGIEMLTLTESIDLEVLILEGAVKIWQENQNFFTSGVSVVIPVQTDKGIRMLQLSKHGNHFHMQDPDFSETHRFSNQTKFVLIKNVLAQ